MRRTLVAMLLLAAGSAPRASSLSNELSAGLVQKSPSNPQSNTLTDQLRGHFDLGEDWDLLVGAGFTHGWSTPAPAGGHYPSSAANVASLTAGPTWDVTPR